MPRTVLSPFSRLKQRVIREFPKKKLVGDIVISPDEYQLLVNYLRTIYRGLLRDSVRLSTDPVLVVALVQIGIKHYDGGYWPHLAREVGVSQVGNNHRNKLGECLWKTLRANNRAYHPNEVVKTILMHGFVSTGYADDLFNFLFAFYRLDLERDLDRCDTSMMRSLIDAMIRNDNTGRTYWLVQQTADAIRSNPVGAKIRIRRLLRLIDQCFWEQAVPVNSTNRLSQCFVAWREKSKEFNLEYQKYHGGSSNSHGKKSFSSPYIHCDFSGPSFTLCLSPQLISFDHGVDVTWRLHWRDTIHNRGVDLYQGVTGYKTGEASFHLSLDMLYEDINLDLMCGENRIRRFRIPRECARFFTKTGQGIMSENLPTGEVYAVTMRHHSLESEALVSCENRGVLTLHYFNFQYGDIVRLPTGSFLSIGRKIEEGLLPRARVTGAYGVNNSGTQLPLYRKAPAVMIRMLPSREPGTFVEVNGVRYRLSAANATVIEIGDRTGEKGYVINLASYGCVTDGIYRLYIDVPNDRTSRFWEFCLLDGFSFEFEDAPYVFVPRGTIRFNDSLRVQASSILEKLLGENAFNFEIEPDSDALEFEVRSGIGTNLIRTYVPALKWKFDADNWNIMKPNELWHAEFPRTIFIKYPDDVITLGLDDPAEDDISEQTVTYAKNKERHVFECDVARFRSWFGRETVLRRLYIFLSGKRREFVDVITRSVVASCIIRASYASSVLVGDVSIIGKSDYYVDVKYEGETIAEKQPVIDQRFELSSHLKTGKYEVALFETEGDDTGFGESVYWPLGSYTRDLVNALDLGGKSLSINGISDTVRKTKLNLNCDYYIDQLVPVADALGNYISRMCARSWDGRILGFLEVKVEFFDLERLGLVRLSIRDEDEYVAPIYDFGKRIIVAQEDKRLHRSERYRRYIPLYEDETTFFVDFVPRDTRIRWPVESPRDVRINTSSTIRHVSPQNEAYDKIIATSIEDLGLTIRTFNCLNRAKLHTVQNIIDYPISELHRVRNLGLTSKAEIIEKLVKLGLEV